MKQSQIDDLACYACDRDDCYRCELGPYGYGLRGAVWMQVKADCRNILWVLPVSALLALLMYQCCLGISDTVAQRYEGLKAVTYAE